MLLLPLQFPSPIDDVEADKGAVQSNIPQLTHRLAYFATVGFDGGEVSRRGIWW